jgi:sulfur oxidation c-type cytochrome SoxX
MKAALAIAAFVILIIHGLVFYNQFFHAWERNQTAYFDQARSQAKNDEERAELAARRPKIEQIMVTQFGETRVDRCTTCHIAADDPRFMGHFEPLHTHPYSEAMGDRQVNGRWERRHKFTNFGCTLCHDGQGRGLKPYYAHGEDPFWPDPMLGYVAQKPWKAEYRSHLTGKEYLEVNCAQCHSEQGFSGTPTVDRGRTLFFQKACYGCHRIQGISEGTLGPDLTEVGRKFKVDYLWESIVDPRANIATSFMPKFNLTEDEVKALVVFLKSRKGFNLNETSLERYLATVAPAGKAPAAPVSPAVELAASSARGQQLIQDRACVACHKLGASDGGIAPDLSYEGLEHDRDWIAAHFRNPREKVPDSIMPAFHLSAGEIGELSDYLTSLQSPPPLAGVKPAEVYATLCARCHGEKGLGNGPIALYLDPSPRDLTNAAFMNGQPRARFETALQNGVAGTSMPAWGRMLDASTRSGLLDYVFATFVSGTRTEPKARNLPEMNPVAQSLESAGRGEAIFLKRCVGCHGRKADGKGPNSLDILPRPRNLRNSFFVASASDRRLMESVLYGVQGTAMPPWIDYGLSQNDAGDLVNFIRGLNERR